MIKLDIRSENEGHWCVCVGGGGGVGVCRGVFVCVCVYWEREWGEEGEIESRYIYIYESRCEWD